MLLVPSNMPNQAFTARVREHFEKKKMKAYHAPEIHEEGILSKYFKLWRMCEWYSRRCSKLFHDVHKR